MVLANPKNRKITLVFLHSVSLLPFVINLVSYFSNQLSADPIRDLLIRSGRYAVFGLLLSLMITPINYFRRIKGAALFRKVLGLYGFMYAAIHFLVFIGLDFHFQWQWIIEELKFKPFLIIGLISLTLLLVMAVTSIKFVQKNIGKTWRIIHRMIYPVMILISIHIFLSAKGDYRLTIMVIISTTVLFLIRIPVYFISKTGQQKQIVK